MAARVYGSEIRTIVLEGMEIRYELTRKSVKNVNLRIDAAGNVKVSASRRVPVNYIEGFMRQKQALIVTAVERAEENSRRQQEKEPQTERQYADGEQLTLLGNKHEVKIVRSELERIDLDNRFIYFWVKKPEDIRHKELLYEKWLKEYQRGVYEEICHQVHKQFQQFRVDYPVIKIRRMTSRWGSCQPYKGVVTLNSRLIETPLCCIEYVVMHEFCHFIHPDHSKAFHALMTRLMPDWKQRRQLLNSISEWN
ncbi:MAG: M48 family metallopeptidase [Lachnospiraceae bacterium]|nr:M48 family metallopeptidase [Lachnospiraceae bacterium]